MTLQGATLAIQERQINLVSIFLGNTTNCVAELLLHKTHDIKKTDLIQTPNHELLLGPTEHQVLNYARPDSVSTCTWKLTILTSMGLFQSHVSGAKCKESTKFQIYTIILHYFSTLNVTQNIKLGKNRQWKTYQNVTGQTSLLPRLYNKSENSMWLNKA